MSKLKLLTPLYNKSIYRKTFDDNSFIIMTTNKYNFRQFNHYRTVQFVKKYFSKKSIAKTRQVHHIKIISDPISREYIGVDGFYLEKSNIPIMIVTADCIPMLVRSKKSKKVALLHAGWKGVKKRIYFHSLNRFKENKKDIEVYLLPSISKESFEIKDDFIQEFNGRYFFKQFLTKNEKSYFDLKSFVKKELVSYGIPKNQIYIEEHDTYKSGIFHSYRREGKNYGLNAIIFFPNIDK